MVPSAPLRGLAGLVTCDMLQVQGLNHCKRANPKPDLIMNGMVLMA